LIEVVVTAKHNGSDFFRAAPISALIEDIGYRIGLDRKDFRGVVESKP